MSAIMGLDEKLIAEIVRRILSVSKPDRIILFGSAATDRMTRDSDIDLLVLEGEPGPAREEWDRIDEVLQGLGFPVDVLVMGTDRFEATKDVIGGIAHPAAKYGRVVYAAA